jgi:multidrug efflux pump subunit AcrA (membrane-fusion protein)
MKTITAIFAIVVIAPPLARAQTQPPAPVTVAPVVEREVKSEQTFSATIMPRRRSVVGSAVDGRVVEFPINEGDRVVKGQKLAQLLTKTIELEIAAADAQYSLRKHELAEMRAGTRPEDKLQAEARTAAAAALANYAKRRLGRIQELARRGTTTPDQLEEATSQYNNAQKLHEAAQAAYELAKAGPRAEQILQAEAREAAAKAELDRLKDMMSKYTIVAPFDGYVSSEHTEIGHWISQGDPVAEIVELDELEVSAMVLESHIPHIGVGTPAVVSVSAVPNRQFAGEVVHIAPLADLKSRSFPVKVGIKNPVVGDRHLLKAGMLARATLAVGQAKTARLVPRDAIVLAAKPFVYVVDPAADGAGKVRSVEIETGVAVDDWIEVRGQLKPGDRVVVEGNERRRPGDLVRAISERPFKPQAVKDDSPAKTTQR